MSLALAALATRLPFRSQFLYHWDSVNFALSLEHYDVRLHQPHPPGYLLYSMLVRLVNAVVHDANASLVWISLFSGALSVLALYWLGTIMFGRSVGQGAALLALTNPLHWFYNQVALSYALEFLLVTILAGLFYLQLLGGRQTWFWSAILLGIAGGIRQNDLVFLLPLWLVSLWPLAWKQRVTSCVTLVITISIWAWPMMALSGGPTEYLAALRAESSGIANESSLLSFQQLALNSVRMATYLGYGLLLGAVPLLWGARSLIRARRVALNDPRAWVLTLWTVPSVCFYILVHLRQPGHIFTFLPAVILLTALATQKLGQCLDGAGCAWQRMLAITLAVVNGLFFLLAPTSLFNSEQLPLQTPSRQTIAQRDRFLGERIAYIQTHFDPTSTVILAGGLNFRHPEFYLREFQETALSYQLGQEATLLPHRVHTLVFFDDTVWRQYTASPELDRLPLPSGATIQYTTWDSSQQARLSRTMLEISK